MTIYTGSNATVGPFFDLLETFSEQYKSVQAELIASDGDADKARAAWLESTDDPQVAKLRAAIESANAKLAELAEKNVTVHTLSDEEKKAKADQLKSLREKVKKGRELVLEMAEMQHDDSEGVRAALESYPDVTKSRKGISTGGAKTGSSLPRASVDLYVTGGKIDQKFETFSAAAKALNTDVETLQLAFADAAGVEHKEIASVKTPQEFKVDVVSAEGDAVTYEIHTTPKKLAAKASE